MKTKILKFLALTAAFCGMTAWGATHTVATQEEFATAVSNAANGDAITLSAGTFDTTELSTTANLSFVGTGESTIIKIGNTGDGSNGHGLNWSGSLSFKNLVLVDNGSTSGYLTGFTGTGALTFDHVTFNSGFSNWGNQGGAVTFTYCTFNQTDASKYCVAELRSASGTAYTFDHCTFTAAGGRFINAYKQGGVTSSISLSVQDCTFENTGSASKAAVNIKDDASDGCSVAVTFVGTNTAEGNFPSSAVSPLFATQNKGNATVYLKDTQESEAKTIYASNAKTDDWVEPNGYTPASSTPAIAKIGTTEYSTLAEAIAAATAGQTVEILVADTYTLPDLPNNITVKGSVEGVVFNCVGTGSIASVQNGATFQSVEFNMGTADYHGFYGAGTINMVGCTINGKFFSYGVMNFTECTFNQTASDYCMWCYGTDLTYTRCTFNTAGKALNVYCEGQEVAYNVTVVGCTFNSTKKNKAAVNVKETSGSNMLKYNVVVQDCTIGTPDYYPTASTDATGTLYIISPLVQVDDRNLNAEETYIAVTTKETVSGVVQETVAYPLANPVAQIGTTEYTSLAAALDAAVAATEATTIKILRNVTEQVENKKYIFNQNVTITADSAVTIDFNGLSLGGQALVPANGSTLTIGENVTIDNLYNFGTYRTVGTAVIDGTVKAVYVRAMGDAAKTGVGKLVVNGTLVGIEEGCLRFENNGEVVFNGTIGQNESVADAPVLRTGLYVNNSGTAKIVLNNASVQLSTIMTPGNISYELNHSGLLVEVSQGASLTVGGSLKMDATSFVTDLGGDGDNGKIFINSGATAELKAGAKLSVNGTFTNNGTLAIDATGITEPTKVVDYTGTGTMTLADYGTVSVTGGEAYVEDNDLWVKKASLKPCTDGFYHITSMDDLNTFRDMVNGGETFAGKTAVLDNDITFTGTWDGGIGDASHTFNGTFDGQNHILSGLTVSGTSGSLGLFGKTSAAIIKDLTVSGASVTGSGNFGGVLAGQGFTTTFTNVKVLTSTVNVDGAYVGGVVGGNYSSVYDSTIIGNTITGKDQVGGVMGYACGTKIQNCTVTGNTVTATEERAGLIAGKIQAADGGTLTITGNTVGGTATAPDMAGGIAAQMMGAYATYEIKDNTIDGTLTAEKTSPIAVLRDGQATDFTSKLADNITKNMWTDATLAADSYTYTNTNGAGDQVVNRPVLWTDYAAAAFASEDATAKTITIATADQLALLAKRSIAGESFAGYTITLTADIDLAAHKWVPAGNFNGTFNGQNKTIKNMVITGTAMNNAGLFAKLDTGATVKDLVLSDASITLTSGTYHGVLAGQISGSAVSNVTVTKSTVDTNGKYVGGLYGSGYAHAANCTVTENTVKGKDQVGGLVGYLWVGHIENCTVTGNMVVASEERAGGLVGKMEVSSQNLGTSAMWLKGNTVSGSATAPDMAGGLCGQIMGDTDKYEIKNNDIAVTLSAPQTSPIGVLRSSQPTAYTSKLAANITGNWWEDSTLAANSYTYAADTTNGAGDQTVYRAAVVTIGNKGFRTLAAALIAAQSGDTIEILAGTYGAAEIGTLDPAGTYTNANSVRSKSLTIQAAEGATVTFTSTVSLGYDDSSTCHASMTVKGLKFSGASLQLSNYLTVDVENCTFENGTTANNGVLVVQDSCCKLSARDTDNSALNYAAGGVTIKNCSITGSNSGTPAIRVRNSGNVTITGNTITSSQHNGILMESNGSLINTVAKSVVIMNNKITEWNATNTADSGRAMRLALGTLAEGSTLTVTGNTFRKTTTGLDTPDFAKITGVGAATVSLENNDWNDELRSTVSGNSAYYSCDTATAVTLAAVVTTKVEPVAQVGDTKYQTFADAIAAANESDPVATITVLNYDSATMTAPAGYKFATNEGVTTLVLADFYQAADGVWHIRNTAGFAEFRDKANTGALAGTDKNNTQVVLDADVDLENAAWTPVNMKYVTFDGQNHTVKNFTATSNGESQKNVGLFGDVDLCTIKNLKVENATVSGINHVAALAAHGVCLKVENCHVKNSTVTTTVADNDDGDKAGAIVGYLSAESDAWVKNCTVENCTVKGYRDVGGAVGYANGAAEVTNVSVKNTTLINDRTVNYKNYTQDAQFDVNQIIGEKSSSATATQTNATKTVVKPVTADCNLDADLVYHITSLQGLKDFRDMVNSGANFAGTTVVLDVNVDLGNEEWTPIKASNLTFDGNGKTISNLKITSDQKNVGLFGEASSCTIKNLTIDGANVTGINHVAALAGDGLCAHITNCTVKNATVTTVVKDNDDGDKAGAICGYLSGEPTAEVTNCTVENCTVTGYRDIGGAVGFANGYATVTGTMVQNTTVVSDRLNNANYKNYTSDAQCDAGLVVGETVSTATVSGNTSETVVKVVYVKPVAQIGTTKYATVAAALIAAQSGDTIEILAGTYGAAEIGTLDAPGSYTNANSVRYKSLTIQPAEGAVVTFTSNLSLGYDDSSTANATMTVKNLKFDGASLMLSNYVQATVEGCTFVNGTSSTAGTLIIQDACCKNHKTTDTYPASQVTIKNCTIDGSNDGASGIRLRNSGNVTITGCTIKNSKFNGILMESNGSVDNTVAKSIVITGNTITEWNATNTEGEGRAMRLALGTLAEGSTVTVTGNTFRKTTTGLDTPDFAKITGVGAATVSLENNDWNDELRSTVSGNSDYYSVDTTTSVTLAAVVTTKVEPVAQVTVNGVTTKYTTLQAAFAAAGTSSSAVVTLLADVDLTGVAWTPVNFNGTFDGANHKISNLTANLNLAYGGGFFGNLIGATVKGVTFENCAVSSTLTNAAGRIKGNVYGVVAGYAYGNVTFENVAVVNCSVKAYGKVAAILGMAADPGTTTTTFKNCTVENTTVQGTYNCATYCGTLQNKIVMENCTGTATWVPNSLTDPVDSNWEKYDTVAGYAGTYAINETDPCYCVAWADKYTEFRADNGQLGDELADGIVINFYQDAADANLWHVKNLAGLLEFAESVNNGTSYAGKTVKLDADIDMTSVSSWPTIGTASDKAFAGTFDGNNKTISNLTANLALTYGGGFFGNLTGDAVVKNVTFDNVKIQSTLTNAAGRIKGNVYGVVAAYAYGNVTFEGVTVKNCLVKAYGKVAAILGMAAQPGTTTTTFKNSTVENTTVQGTYNCATYCGTLQNKIVLESCTGTATWVPNSLTDPVDSNWDKYDTVFGYAGTYAINETEPYYCVAWADKYTEFRADNGKLGDELANGIEPAYVAQVGETKYVTLEAAIAAAKAGTDKTVKLVVDLDLTQYGVNAFHTIDLNGLTLDLNGHTITSNNGGVAYDGYDVTIKNGTFVCANGGSYALFYGNGSYGEIVDGVVIEDVTCVGGINVYAADVTIRQSSTGTTSVAGTKYYAVWGDSGSIITIEGGSFAAGSGSTVHNTGNNASYIAITGGTFTGSKNIADNAGCVEVSGGTFSQPVEEKFCAEGYYPVDNGDGTYGVAEDVMNELVGLVDEATKIQVVVPESVLVKSGVSAGATVADKNAYINTVEANGLKFWQNYAMGVDGTVAGNKILTTYAVGAGETITVKTPIAAFNPPTGTGVTVTYRLYKTTTPEDAASWTVFGTQTTPEFPVDLSTQTGDTFWKIEAVFTGTAANE